MVRWLVVFMLPTVQSLAAADTLDFVVEGDAIPAPLVQMTGSTHQGRDVFVNREAGHCVLCHRVAALETAFQGDIGPALDGIGMRLSSGQIRLRIVDASRLNPDTIMPPYYRASGLDQVAEEHRGNTVLSAAQIEHLVAWLSSLRERDE
jgi:sulfur-oxidizing protein SoxX